MQEKQTRYAELVALINKHNKLYYESATPEISDSEYDKLFAELVALESDPEIEKAPDSPTARVGNDTTDGFVRAKHATPMLSIRDVFEVRSDDNNVRFKDALEWATAVSEIYAKPDCMAFIVEPKVDGCAVSLMYEHGELVRAVTRGDGEYGDDITENLRHVPEIVWSFTPPDGTPDKFELRGEVVIHNNDFAKMNIERLEAGLKPYANPRNLTAGTIKTKCPAEAAERPMHFYPHSMAEGYDAMLDVLRAMNVPELPAILCGSSDVPRALNEVVSCIKPLLPYNIDGAVVKVGQQTVRQSMGTTSHHPLWCIAMKYLPERVETVVESITLQVGRTGVVTPVAELRPVHVSGSVVSRATLHNQDEIDRKDIRIGDTVVIEKSGEIIPAVVEVVRDKRPEGSEPYRIMHVTHGKCPKCGEPLSQREGEVAIRCDNPHCVAQLSAVIQNAFSRRALDVKGIGPRVADALVNLPGVSSLWDIFTPGVIPDTLTYADGRQIGSGVMGTLRNIRQLCAEKPLKAWIVAANVPLVGETFAKELSKAYKSLDAILGTQHAALAVKIGPAAASAITACKDLWKCAELIAELDVQNPDWIDPEAAVVDGKLTGKTFVITGKLDQPRAYYEALITTNGGKFSGSIGKSTSYLVAGDGGGSKREKAAKLGIPVISLDDLMNMINA